jgi:mono/diheme cytochrome c family protein
VIKRLILTALACCIAAGGGWLLHRHLAETQETTFLRWQDPAVVARGEGLYRAHCARCHGVPGTEERAAAGHEATPHDAAGHTWEHPDYALFQLVRDGVAVANCVPVDPEQMPRFKGILTDADLVAVLSNIKSTGPAELRASHDRVNVMYGPYNRAVGELIGAGGG